MPVPRKTKWGAVNVLLHWALYGLLLIQTVTGFLLYLGHGGWWVTIHSFTATAVLIYIVAHSISHFCYGGLQQLLRLFRPSALVPTKATRSRPFLIAASVGSVVAASLVLADYGTLDDAPDPRHRGARGAEARRRHGRGDVEDRAPGLSCAPCRASNLGGLGESTVEIRAVHDDKKIYFAFRWEDPSRSLRRLPMIKKEDGWHVVGNRADTADVTTSTRTSSRSCSRHADGFGNARHRPTWARRRSADRAAAAERARLPLHHRRQLRRHVAVEGLARRHPRLRRRPVHSARRTKPSREEAAGKARYQGGYWNDPGRAFYSYNYKIERRPHGPVQVQRLPKDLARRRGARPASTSTRAAATTRAPRWWMTEAETVPYTKELDARIPVGTVHARRAHHGRLRGRPRRPPRRREVEGRPLDARDQPRPQDRQQVRQRLRAGQGPSTCGSRCSTTTRPATPATCGRCRIVMH